MVGKVPQHLITGVSQAQVDFVIPLVRSDLPLGIDPFLLFKSRNPTLARLHDDILAAFNAGVVALRNGDEDSARHILRYPEVSEIGLGYTRTGKKGSGVGEFLTELLVETLKETPAILEQGVRHVEEMQLVSVGIGADRVSDISANVMKRYLIEYTQAQCRLWSIPLSKDLPLHHIWEASSFSWEDGYFDLPANPSDGSTVLFVPRRIVRTLPWINYDDFVRTEFNAYLRAKRVRTRLAEKRRRAVSNGEPPKKEVVQASREDYGRVRKYVAAKEATAAQARPSLEYLDRSASTVCQETQRLSARLAALPSGQEQAADYQRLVLEILNTCFAPELIHGELEVRTVDGTERRDIILLNDSDHTFWDYVRGEHSGLLLAFDTKNTKQLDADDFNQVATYLGDRLGRLGFIITREAPSEANMRKAFSIYNDSTPRKIIVVLSDNDMTSLLDVVCRGGDPTNLVRAKYRRFRQDVQ